MEINPVKGTHDIIGQEAENFEVIERVCRNVADLYGYKEIRTPVLEHTPLFLRSVGESSDIVTKEMYTFLDKGNRSVTLRPEMTAGVMRSIVTNKLYASGDLPLKYYYIGQCFRYERPQAGRYRQFHQFGVEAVGAPSYQLDAETIALGYRVFSALGVEGIKVKINSLGDEETRTAYKAALKEYFASHIENMCEDCKRRYEINPLRILDCKVPEDIEIVKGAPKLSDYLSQPAKLYLNSVIEALKSIGIECEIDNNLVRGLDYYTGVVWEYHAGEVEGLGNIGALGGGGHYANLLKEIGGPDLEGVGMSIGLERLQTVFDLLGKRPSLGVDFYIMGLTEKIIEKAFGYADLLRREGMSVEMNYDVKSFKSLFKTAVRKNAKFAIIIGEDEDEKGEIQVKNLKTQDQTTVRTENMVQVLSGMVQEYMESMFQEMIAEEMK